MKKILQRTISVAVLLPCSLLYAENKVCETSTVEKIELHKRNLNIAKGDGIDFSMCTLEGEYISSYQVTHELVKKSNNEHVRTIYVDLSTASTTYELQTHGMTGKPRAGMFVHYQLPLTTLNVKYQEEVSTEKPPTEVVFRQSYMNGGEKTPLARFPITLTYPKTHGANYRDEGPSIPSISNLTGTWYDPQLSGMGFSIVEHSNGTEIFFFGYSQIGEPLWLVSELTQNEWETNVKQTLKMYVNKTDNGGTFNTAPDAGEHITQWGTLDLYFADCQTGKATLTGNDGRQSFDLQLLGNARNVACTKLW